MLEPGIWNMSKNKIALMKYGNNGIKKYHYVSVA